MIAAEFKPGTQISQELKIKEGNKETISYWLFLPKSYDKKSHSKSLHMQIPSHAKPIT